MTATTGRDRARLVVTGLHVRYPNGAHAVRGVDLALAAGETVALVGESGCGKTTIAHAILGLLPPRTEVRGSIRLPAGDSGGADAELVGLGSRDLRQIRGRRIGYVGQNPYRAFDPLRSVAHHVASAWLVHGERPPPDAVTHGLEQLGIVDARQRARLHPHQWSGGMLQRASIAAAEALAPDVIIADEPTSALDADLARETLLALRGTGAGVLLVTHDLALAEEIADTIHVLYGGEVMERGGAGSILGAPRHPYTQALLAAVPRRGAGLPAPLPGTPPDPRRERSGCALVDRCPMAHARCRVERPALVEAIACYGAPT